MGLIEIVCVHCISLSQDRDQWRSFVKTVVSLEVPASWATVIFSKRALLLGVRGSLPARVTLGTAPVSGYRRALKYLFVACTCNHSGLPYKV
jgi:hypothetical protein